MFQKWFCLADWVRLYSSPEGDPPLNLNWEILAIRNRKSTKIAQNGVNFCCSSDLKGAFWCEGWYIQREITPRCCWLDLATFSQAAHRTRNSCTQKGHALALPLLHHETSGTGLLIWFQGLFLSSCSIPASIQLQTSQLHLSPAARPKPALATDLDTQVFGTLS